MSVSVDLTGEPAVHEMFGKFTPAELYKKASRATRAGAKVLKAPLSAAARPSSSRMSRAVAVRSARKAKDRPGAIVVFKRKGPAQSSAFFAHFVILGTSRGVKGRPFVGPAVEPHEAEALDVMVRELGL